MTILAAIGEEHRSNPVITVGYDLATAYDEPLSVLHVVPEEDFQAHRESMADLPEAYSQVTIEQEEDSAKRFARSITEETLGEFDQSRVSTLGRVGDPVEQVLGAADTVDARYLVIGGRRRSPAGKAIFGSATQSILLQADLPVMTVMTKD